MENENMKIAKLLQEVMLLFRHKMTKVVEDTGITTLQMMIMGIISKEKTLKITELSGKLSLSNSTVSGIVDKMEKLGMVERTRSERDRRVVYVSISPNFVEMHKTFHERFEENIALTINKSTPEELNKILEGLEVLKRLLKSQEK
ncbi:MarR family winged helix-turn-helix transcriptional regulator [Desulfosporosinus metallidurans]|uniref:Transcriptional regulator, MarR family n=1 Tax=Desulfosporosinus metallidurans TaxID=1888891 RepID=A0A1Q8R0N3_9FIRM|nr:MarR family transcriptional regulator [Desulfosporosinus metallidurans]OLN33135.1 Transcriptional regulator, MarR family [Desulfosporosinus metallidurans]